MDSKKPEHNEFWSKQRHYNEGDKDEWFTPPHIIEPLQPFDLDVCSNKLRRFVTADKYFTFPEQDGLKEKWFGHVWMNPPYKRGIIELWMELMANHNDGIALIFARTDTQWFQKFVFQRANSIYFIKGRLKFYETIISEKCIVTQQAKNCAMAPSVLVGYGNMALKKLKKYNAVDGKLILL